MQTIETRLCPVDSRLWLREFWQENVCALISCGVVLACVLIANPFSAAGFIDDWSYSHLALKLAETGHIQYDGWGSPTLLFQGLWAAAWIRLLGFSFDLMRFITLPFSLGFVFLIYATGRRLGLRRDLSLFGALTVGTAPLFLPLAASFMTDVYGCFFCMLCIYAAITSAESDNRRLAVFWLWTLAISGILGGSDRQIVWIAPLALIPYLYWARRIDRRFSLHAAAALVLCVGTLVLITLSFRPPYAPFALQDREIWKILAQNTPSALAILLGLFLACLLVGLPALFCFSRCWRDLGPGRVIIISLISFAAIVLLAAAAGQFGAAPFAIGILSEFGVLLNGWDSLGFKPVVLQPALRICVSALVLFTGIAFYLLRDKSARLASTPKTVFLIFSLAYCALLLPGAILSITFDRYVLPLVPGIVLFVLDRFQRRVQRIPMLGWACLAVGAAYAVVITHDYASSSRARVRAADFLQTQKIARVHISAGFEYDGWTQLETTGTITGTTYRNEFEWNRTDRFWFWHFAKVLQPEYVVSSSRVANAGGVVLASVPFTTWLPPFHRFAIVQRREDLPTGPVCNTLRPCSLP
jgi:hypothetical protein